MLVLVTHSLLRKRICYLLIIKYELIIYALCWKIMEIKPVQALTYLGVLIDASVMTTLWFFYGYGELVPSKAIFSRDILA